MMQLQLKIGNFDTVVGFYSLVHLAREEQVMLIEKDLAVVERWRIDASEPCHYG